jgi:hypothetical protein
VGRQAQCAPSGHAGFADGFDECAQTRSARVAKWPVFLGDFEKARVQKTVASANAKFQTAKC